MTVILSCLVAYSLLSRRAGLYKTANRCSGDIYKWYTLLLGWGRISGDGPAADILQQAKLPLASHEACVRKYGNSIDRGAHLCAGEGRSGASGGCNGDSGGPLVCEMGGKWYLHGAVSFGRQRCPTTHFTVFARITTYKSWILQMIGESRRSIVTYKVIAVWQKTK